MSKIVSAEGLRRMLSEDKENDDEAATTSVSKASGRSSRMTTVSTPIKDLRPSPPQVAKYVFHKYMGKCILIRYKKYSS